MTRNGIVQQPTVHVKRIYNVTVVHLHQHARHGAAAPLLPDFHSMRSSLCRRKASQCPPVPQGINDLDNTEGVATFSTDTFFGTGGG